MRWHDDRIWEKANNLCCKTKAEKKVPHGIWWDRWNDNNFCYCLFLSKWERFIFRPAFACMHVCVWWFERVWALAIREEKKNEEKTIWARHGIEFKLQSVCDTICISGNSNHDRWLRSRRQLSLVTTNNKLQNAYLVISFRKRATISIYEFFAWTVSPSSEIAKTSEMRREKKKNVSNCK